MPFLEILLMPIGRLVGTDNVCITSRLRLRTSTRSRLIDCDVARCRFQDCLVGVSYSVEKTF